MEVTSFWTPSPLVYRSVVSTAGVNWNRNSLSCKVSTLTMSSATVPVLTCSAVTLVVPSERPDRRNSAVGP